MRKWVLFSLAMLLAASVFADGPRRPFPRNAMAPAGPDAKDATVEMLGPKELAMRQRAAQVGTVVATNVSRAGQSATEGEELVVSVSDMGLNVDYDETFVVLLDGEHGIILIEKAAYDNYDAATGEYVFPNPSGTFARFEDRISTAQLQYLLQQFDTVIYPTDTSVFGQPLARGPEGQKTWVLIHNIRDEAYYDSTQTTYVAGYFSSSEDAANNKNMMHIDSYDWANRTGPGVARPFLYEGVFAHEFEHLIHFDQDPDEPSWVDEGLADLAGFLCGYGHSSGHVAYYLVYHPVTALTFWGGGLESYGASYLFQLYLFEKYGGRAFTSALVQEQANGIEGVQKTLAAFGYQDSFKQVFTNWAIANYIDDTRKGGGKYGYETLEIGGEDSWGYSLGYSLLNFWYGPPVAAPVEVSSDLLTGSDPQPYTAQYLWFNSKKAATVKIDGDDNSGTLPNSGTYEWYSDAEAWAWRSFYQTFAVPAGGAFLSFHTFFDIEEDWDYGYVEVYDRDTGLWSTLPAIGGGTVSNLAHPQDNPNTPVGREPMDYAAAGKWNAFTGSSGGWVAVSMDLSDFAGHSIDLYFTTWQDGAFTLQMMYVDDISFTGISFQDGAENGPGDWTTTGWYITDGIRDNGFGVATLDTKWVPVARYPEPAGNKAMELHSVSVMSVDPSTESGQDKVKASPESSGRTEVSLVINFADHILNSHYEWEVK